MSNLQDDYEARLRTKRTVLGITKPTWVLMLAVAGVFALLMILSGAFGAS